MSEKLDLDGIKARLAAATPGPWIWHASPWEDHAGLAVLHFPVYNPKPGAANDVAVTVVKSAADASFIAHAPEDIAALVAEVERLRADADRSFPDRIKESLDRAEVESEWPVTPASEIVGTPDPRTWRGAWRLTGHRWGPTAAIRERGALPRSDGRGIAQVLETSECMGCGVSAISSEAEQRCTKITPGFGPPEAPE